MQAQQPFTAFSATSSQPQLTVGLSFRRLKSFQKRLLAKATGRQNAHFLHLRKTGGTTLKSVLGPNQVTPKAVLYLHPHRITLADIPRGHRVMFVTRDPVSRFISGFNGRMRKGAPSLYVEWTAEEALAFSRFASANSLALALNPEHPAHPEALAAMKAISHLRGSYWDWFIDERLFAEREPDILFIGQIETFDDDFEQLKQPLGLPHDLQLPNDPKATNRSSTSHSASSALEPAAIELVKNWYRRDEDFLDLCAAWRTRHRGPVAL